MDGRGGRGRAFRCLVGGWGADKGIVCEVVVVWMGGGGEGVRGGDGGGEWRSEEVVVGWRTGGGGWNGWLWGWGMGDGGLRIEGREGWGWGWSSLTTLTVR